MGFIGNIVGGILGAGAAQDAANAQAQAAEKAAGVIGDAGQSSSRTNTDIWNQTQANEQPWLTAGTNAINAINTGLQQGGQFSRTPQFSAPTGITMQNDPGYQFRLAEGQKAIERSAAAKGGVLGAGTQKALSRYGQDYASGEYGNVYNRAMQQYQADLNSQNTLFDRYNTVSGTGAQVATTQGNQGQAYSNANSDILMTTADRQGKAYQDAGDARASGYIGKANAYNNMIGNMMGLGGMASKALFGVGI